MKCLLQDEAQKETRNLDHKELAKTRPHPAEAEDGLNALSANVLGEINNRRPQQYGNDVVENYLRTFGPLVYYHFPNYNCPHQECEFSRNLSEIQDQQQHQQLPTISEKKSISVSTDSEPNLQSTTTHMDAVKVENDGKPMSTTKQKDQDYLVMHSTGVGQLQAGYTVDKFGRPPLDFKMQQILETLRENSINQRIPEKPEIIKDHLKKLPLTGVEGSAQILPQPQIPNLPMSILPKGYDGLTYIEPPFVSFHMPTFSPEPAKDIGSIKSPPLSSRSPPSAKILNIPRLPLQCPESKCGRMLFISDFIRHLAVDHTNLLMERISSNQRKIFCLDPHLLQCDSNKCHLLYLLRDAIVDLGNSEYKDYLPVLLMTSRVSFKQMCGEMKKEQSAERDQHSLEKCLVVWLTGLLPENHSISVSLDLRPIMDAQMRSCYIQYSGDMYSIRNSQNVVDVWKSGQMLLLSAAQVEQLTNGGKDMLEIQVEIH